MIQVVGVFGYFCYFPDYAGKTAVYVGSNFCFVKVNAVFCCQIFGYR
jgi:hypothetical protein